MSDFWERANRDPGNGQIMDGDTRYVLFRTDVIAAVVNQLPEEARHATLNSFTEAVKQHGGKSLARYLGMVEGDVDALLATVEATAPALGWGVWRFERTPQRLSLTVRNSPFVAFETADQASSCAPILGMFTALAEMVLEQVSAEEISCGKSDASECSFVAEKLSS